MYPTQEVAENALIETWTRFDFTPDNGPVAVYQCEDCGQFHLTSRGPMNETLSLALREGKIARQKQANQWAHKWKRR